MSKPDMQLLQKNPTTRRIPVIYALVGVLVGVALMGLQLRQQYARAVEAEYKADEAMRKAKLAEEQANNFAQERMTVEEIARNLKHELQARQDEHRANTDKLRAELELVGLNVEKAKVELTLAAESAPDRRRKEKADADTAEARANEEQTNSRLSKIEQKIAETTQREVKAEEKSISAKRTADAAQRGVEGAEEELQRLQAAVGTRWRIKSPINGILTDSDGSELSFSVRFEQDDIVTVLEAPKGATKLKIGYENDSNYSGWLLWEKFSTFLDPGRSR